MASYHHSDMNATSFFQHLVELTEAFSGEENDPTDQEDIIITQRVVLRSEGYVNTENLVLIHRVYKIQEQIVNRLLEAVTSKSKLSATTDEEKLIDREKLRVCFAESVSPITEFSSLYC